MSPLTQPTRTGGVVERMIYAVVLAVMMKLVQKGYIDQDMAIYLATGAVALFGGAYGWYINRPSGISQSAVANLPTATATDKTAMMSAVVANLSTATLADRSTMVSAVADLPEVAHISLDRTQRSTPAMNQATPDNVRIAA